MKKSVVILIAIASAVTLSAQQPAAPASAVTIPVGTRVGELLTGYEDGGRRDPFASLVVPRRPVAGQTVDASRGRTGLVSLALADVKVTGIVKSGTAMIAILQGPNRQSFTARLQDKLLDASIQSIDSGGVVFAEHAGSGTPAIQIRKALRSSAEEVR